MDRTTRSVDRPGIAERSVAEELLGADLRDGLARGNVTAFEAPLLAVYRGPVRPTTGAMAMATGAWFALVFALCYIALPALAHLTGLHRTLLDSAPLEAISFGATSFVTAVGAGLVRPTVSAATRDPVLAATAGGFLTWAVLHNVTDALQPFWHMSLVELGTFLTFNVLETFLIGSMLASLTRSRLVAFGIASLWQVVAVGLFVALLAVF